MDTPILLVSENNIPEVVLNELTRLGVKNIILIGGNGTISVEVENILKAKYAVSRIGGATRYDTAVLVGDKVRALTGNNTEAILVDGTNFADAIAVTGMAVEKGAPILLTAPGSLNSSTAKAVKDWKLKNVTIGGGTNSVSASVESALKQSVATERIAGKDRYATSV